MTSGGDTAPDTSARALVLGEALVDVVHPAEGPVRELPGGSPANVAVALARLGANVGLGTAFADDAHGRLLTAHLDAAGVELVGEPHVVARTSSAQATIDAGGAAEYVFDLDWRLDGPGLAAEQQARPPALVHTGSLGSVLEPGAGTVVEVLRRGSGVSLISFDVNARPAATGVDGAVRARVEEIAALSDVIKASDEDLAALWPDTAEADTIARLLGFGAAAVVVTRGGDGVTVHRPGAEALDVPAEAVQVVDTIGAGDSFCAAMLDGLRLRGLWGDPAGLRRLDADGWREVAARAARAASITVSRPGADPPTATELDA